MNKTEFETKSMVYIAGLAYSLNLLFSICGYVCSAGSLRQIMMFQIGNAFAILGSVIAGRYTGIRGQHVAASAYILLGITHGISLAALSRTAISVDRGMTMVMPMIPALVCIFWCTMYPLWLRLAGIIPIIFFTWVYIDVLCGNSYFGWPLQAGYGTLQTIEVLWAVYIYKNWQQHQAAAVS